MGWMQNSDSRSRGWIRFRPKVNLSVSSIGEIHHKQIQVARVLKESTSVRDVELDQIAAKGCLGVSPKAGANFGAPTTSRATPPPPPLRHRPPTPLQVPHSSPVQEEQSSKRPWMPKMEFLRFDGEDVRIWLDNCEAYFLMYQIPDSFKLMSTSLHLHGNTAHWFQSYKLTEYCKTWENFCMTVTQEFEVNMHHTCMSDLLVLWQQGTVQE